ncbi:MAG: hypothetical protein AB2652_04770 [Candidatus Thiodiazotropha endolucinida]
MPKKVITPDTIPVALHILDQWEGRLTWDRYAKKVGEALGDTVTRGALAKWSEIQDAFTGRQRELREEAGVVATTGDVTLDDLKAQNRAQDAEIKRLKRTIARYREQFARWQKNLYMMPGVDMEALKGGIEQPLPPLTREA